MGVPVAFTIELGGSVTVDSTNGVLLSFASVNEHPADLRRGTLVNKLGAARLYIGYGSSAASIVVSAADADGKTWLEAGESSRVPKKASSVFLISAGATLTVHYIED